MIYEGKKWAFIRLLYCYILIAGWAFVIFLFTGFGIMHFLIFALVVCIPLSVLAVYVIEKAGAGLGLFLSGWTPRRAAPKELLSADIQKARYSKLEGRYEEALLTISHVLVKAPDLSEALFLKAQIQWEGFADFSGAKTSLQKLMQLLPRDETLYQWASNYYNKLVREEKQKTQGKLHNGLE